MRVHQLLHFRQVARDQSGAVPAGADRANSQVTCLRVDFSFVMVVAGTNVDFFGSLRQNGIGDRAQPREAIFRAG